MIGSDAPPSCSYAIIRVAGGDGEAQRGLSGRAKRQTREGRLSSFFVLSGE
jgi:hypothetical protein